MIKRVMVLLVVLLLTISGTGFAANWTYVGDNPGGKWYVDNDSLSYYRFQGSIDKNAVEVSVKWELSPVAKQQLIDIVKNEGNYNNKWENVSYFIRLIRYKLDNPQQATVSFTIYTSSGESLGTENPALKYEPIAPNSPNDWIFKRINEAAKSNLIK